MVDLTLGFYRQAEVSLRVDPAFHRGLAIFTDTDWRFDYEPHLR